MQFAVSLTDGVEVGAVQLGARGLAALDDAHRLFGCQAQRVGHARRHPEEVALTIRRVRKDLVGGQRRLRLVLGRDVREVQRMRGRLDALQVELGNLADGLEDRAQLRAETLDLLLRQREARQAGDVQDLIASDCHLPNPRAAPDVGFNAGRDDQGCPMARGVLFVGESRETFAESAARGRGPN